MPRMRWASLVTAWRVLYASKTICAQLNTTPTASAESSTTRSSFRDRLFLSSSFKWRFLVRCQRRQTAVSISKLAVVVKGPLHQCAVVDRVSRSGATAAGHLQSLQYVGAKG